MEEITEKEYDNIAALNPARLMENEEEISAEDFKIMLEEMKNPVSAQQRIAVQIKIFLDKRIKAESEENGFLSDHTRRWVESYNNILREIQKSLYGDKSVNLHVHKISHGEIAAKMRESIIILDKKRKLEK